MEKAEAKRLFIALLPNDDVRDALEDTQRAVQERVKRARPTSRANLHLTLAFLGQLNEDGEWAARDALQQTAQQMAGEAPLKLKLGAVGTFPKRKGGTVIWRGLADGHETVRVRALREILRLHLAANGLSIEEEFVPHMTLARGVRLESPPGLHERQELEDLCAELTGEAPAAACTVDRISLMWSHRPEPDEALTYTEIGHVGW